VSAVLSGTLRCVMTDPGRDPFAGLFTANEPAELRNYLATPGDGLRLAAVLFVHSGSFVSRPEGSSYLLQRPKAQFRWTTSASSLP
jgi:hypothetical protein